MRTTGGDDHLCADSPRIGACAAQRNREIVMTGTVQVAHPIAVDRGGRVEIVHHQIERAVVVEIHVSGAVRESRRDRESTRLNSSHVRISYAVLFLEKNK